jgi:transposase
MTNARKVAYFGKKVFIGIDVHKRSYAVCAMSEGEVVFKGVVPGRIEELLGLIGKRYEGAEVHTAYEAGFSGLVLHRALEAAGIKSIVVNAASIEINARDRVKTDKRDATKIATQLSQGRLRGIRIPSEEEERKRTITRTREQLVRTRSAIMTQIRMKLLQFGKLAMDYTKVLSLKDVQSWLRSPELGGELKVAVQSLACVWESLNVEIKKLEKELKAQAESDPGELIYRSVPGIGRLGARILSNELGDMKQFNNERKLFSFCGLTPSEYSSGEKIRRGHISRQGSSRIRQVLTEAAWVAIRFDADLREAYKRISQRAGGKRAITAIGRKLLGRIRRLFKTGELYSIEEPVASAA